MQTNNLVCDKLTERILNEFENEANSAFKKLYATSRAIEFSNSHQFNTDIYNYMRAKENSLILKFLRLNHRKERMRTNIRAFERLTEKDY